VTYNGCDNWESRIEMEEFDSIESDVEGDREEYHERVLNRGRRKKPLDRVGLTRHMCRQYALGNADDAQALHEEDKEGEDDAVCMSAKAEYAQRRNMLVDHFKVASAKGEVIWY
jgi:DNA-directed RNA polymerase subunit N (RpoN/RPB10)